MRLFMLYLRRIPESDGFFVSRRIGPPPATSTLFSNVQGGGRFNLQLKDIQVKHKGGEADHNVFLRLFAVNAAKTSQ